MTAEEAIRDLEEAADQYNEEAFRMGAAALRRQSELEAVRVETTNVLTNVAQILDVIKTEWEPEGCWSEWDQGVRESISALLRKLYDLKPLEANDDE